MGLQGKRIAESFCRHLVGLSVLVRETCGARRELGDVLTCFVMEVGERWFLVTAGHCVAHMKRLQTCSDYEVLGCGLYDGWASWSRHLVPFNFADSRCHFVDDDDLGLDIGVIEVEPLLRRTLEKGGIVPLGPSLWNAVPEKLIGHVMVGQPSELLRATHDGARLVDFKVDPVVLSVEECEPPEDMRKPLPRFYAKVADDIRLTDGEVLSDIAGMSGGPVFGFQQRPDGQLVCYLVAVQGSWSTKHRVIAAARAWWVGQALALAVESGRDSALAEIFNVRRGAAPELASS